MATAASFFSAKGSVLPAEHTAPYARSACSGRQVSHVHRGSRCSVLSVAVRVRIPAMTPSVGRMLCTGDSSLSFCRCVAKRANREKRSVPLNRASRTAALALWKVKSCSQHSALPIGFHAAMGASHIEVGNATSPLYPLPIGASRTKET